MWQDWRNPATVSQAAKVELGFGTLKVVLGIILLIVAPRTVSGSSVTCPWKGFYGFICLFLGFVWLHRAYRFRAKAQEMEGNGKPLQNAPAGPGYQGPPVPAYGEAPGAPQNNNGNGRAITRAGSQYGATAPAPAPAPVPVAPVYNAPVAAAKVNVPSYKAAPAPTSNPFTMDVL